MHITLYKTESESNRLTKQIREPIAMEGNLRDSSNVVDPVITIAITNPTAYNYMYIEEFGRYYFIKDMKSLRTGLWEFYLHVDVLTTYADKIKQLQVIIDKQESSTLSSENYNDGSYACKEENFTEVCQFPVGFSSQGEFILLTAGQISATA